MNHSDDPRPQDEEDYDSEADEDFNPDALPPVDEAQSSSDEDDPSDTKSRKRKDADPDTVDGDFENSGDEATIAKAKRKKRKTAQGETEDDEGGEGGLVKTRAQRRTEGREKKPLAQASASSVDVNDLWAQMSAPSKPTPSEQEPVVSEPSCARDHSERDLAVTNRGSEKGPTPSTDEPTITIKRTYEFAGQRMEEEKIVPAASQEAKLYLEGQARKVAAGEAASKSASSIPGLRRPKKRASMFDSAGGNVITANDKGPKLNTIEKSKLDWAAHVDQEGISEELDEQRRAKNNYLGRMDFLSRTDARREDEAPSKR